MTPLKIQAVLFDLDGTFADTAPTFCHHLNQMRLKENALLLSNDQVRKWVGGGAAVMVENGLSDLSKYNFEQHKAHFLDAYRHDPLRFSQTFAGIDMLLQELDRIEIPWGIATNKPSEFAHPLIKHLTQKTPPNIIICGDDVHTPKPSPIMLELAAKKLNLPTNQIAYLGDHIRDIQASNAANMPSFACAWGYHLGEEPPIEKWQASHILSAPGDLLSFIAPN